MAIRSSPVVTRTTVRFTKRQMERMHRLIERGRYESQSEIVRIGLDELLDREEGEIINDPIPKRDIPTARQKPVTRRKAFSLGKPNSD